MEKKQTAAKEPKKAVKKGVRAERFVTVVPAGEESSFFVGGPSWKKKNKS